MIGERLREILFFFRTNIVALLAVTVPFAVLASLVIYHFGDPVTLEKKQMMPQWQSALGLSLIYTLALGVKVIAIHRCARGVPILTRTAFLSLFAEALRRWPLFAGISLVTGLWVSGGLILFILPGVWIYARLGYAPILAVTDGLGITAALTASWQRSRHQQLELLTLVLVLGGTTTILTLLIFVLLGQGGAATSIGAGHGMDLVPDMVARSIGELLFCLLTIAFYRLWSLGEHPP